MVLSDLVTTQLQGENSSKDKALRQQAAELAAAMVSHSFSRLLCES